MIGNGRRARPEYPRSGQPEMNGMKTPNPIMAAFVAVALVGVAVGVSGCKEREVNQGSGEAVKYTCSMHSEVVQDKQGNCPKCGMALTEKR